MNNKLFRTILILSLLIAMTFSLTLTAKADCTPDGTDGDDTIVCDTTTDMDGNGDNAVDEDGVTGDDGDDTITVLAGAEVGDDIEGESGDDQITNNGLVEGQITGGNNKDTIINNGTVNNMIEGEKHNDTITNNGTVNDDILGNNGADTIINNGTAESVIGGSGSDTLENNGTINSDLQAGSGKDEITNTGTVNGAIIADDGDDTVTLSGENVQIGDIVDGGPGSDTLDFSMSTYDEGQYNDAKAVIAEGENDGTFAWGLGDITWESFETLFDNLILLVAPAPAPDPAPAANPAPTGSDDSTETSTAFSDDNISVNIDSESGTLSFIVGDTLLASLTKNACENAVAGQVLVSNSDTDLGVTLLVTALGDGQFSVQLYSVADGSLLSNTTISA